jgi:adducin
MKELRFKNTISSGNLSQILDGVTWDELKRAGTDAVDGQKSTEQTIIVGAASKGIIQRDHQHNAKVYKTAYAKNPFDDITDAQLEEYKRLVARKQRGEDVPYEEIPENMRHLLNEPIGERLASPSSPTSPLSEDESETNNKKDKDEERDEPRKKKKEEKRKKERA